MSLLIGFLTFILVVNCLFLMLLVLVQLPKKEAGAGLAFGAGAVDTLIGAGSGNALTKLTKYAAGTFLGMAVLLAVLNAQRHQGSSRSLQQELAKKSSAAPMLPVQGTPAPATGSLSNNNSVLQLNTPGATSQLATNQVLTLTNLPTPPVTVPANDAPPANNPAPNTPAPAQGTETKTEAK